MRKNLKAAQTIHLFVLLLFYPRLTFYYRTVVLLALLLTYFVPLKAQTPTDWHLSRVVDDNSGLPQNSVRSMYYDTATNFLWLATEAGLVRYDGQDARVLDSRALPFLHSMRMLNFFPTVRGKVLGCNNTGEIFSISQNNIQPVSYTNAPPAEAIIFRKGNVQSIAAIETESAFFRLIPSRVAERESILWLTDSTWLTSSDSTILLAQHTRVLHKWPRKVAGILRYILRHNLVYAINSQGQGYCLNIASKQQTPLVVQSDVLSNAKAVFYYDKLNDQPLLLLGNEVYEIVFENSTISTRLLAVLPKLPSYIQSVVFSKNRHHLFVATNAAGLYVYQVPPFHTLTATGDDIKNNNYACVLADSNQVFTSRSLLFNLNNDSSKPLPVPISNLYGMAVDTAGKIWSATYQSINCFNPKQPQSISQYPLLANELLETIYRSKKGEIWLITSRYFAGINSNGVQRLMPRNGGEQNAFHCLTETPDGVLLGATGKDIYRIDVKGKKIVPELLNSQLAQIRNLFVDDDYNCWICTYGEGIYLYQLKTRQLYRLPVDDKGYLQYGHAFITEGRNGFLVPTNKGLFRLNRQNLLQAATTPSTPLRYQYFDVSDGLLTNEFNGGCYPAYNRLANGDILLPAIRGIVRVKMNELPNPVSNLLYLDEVESQLHKYAPAGTLHFTSVERLLTWSLGFAQWDHPNSQGIFYRLDADSNWQRLPVGQRNIQLSGLSGGQHSLIIRHQYGLQQEQFSTISSHFYIEKYYYETGWFWFGLGVLLAILIYTVIRIRLRQLKQKNVQLQQIIHKNTATLSDKNSQLEETLLDLREALKGLRENSVFKDRLIGLIGHDMLLPLRFVARIATHLYEEAATLSPQLAKENSGEIKNTVTELLYLGESLVQWIKLQEGRFTLIEKPIELRQTALEILQVHLPMAAVKNNQLICAIPAGTFCRYDAVLLKVILHNLLLNANKFTSGGTVTIEGAIQHKEIHLAVSDTGIGMQKDMVAALNNGVSVPSQLGTNKEAGWGMGYLLIIDLLRFAHGNMLVKSEPEQGTSIQFMLPLTIDESLS